MATVTKDFRVKNGLVVEGSTATVNGSNVLTENSTEFIQDTAASLFTNGSHTGISFTYDDSGNVINATVDANPSFTTSITFEGATADAYETTLQVTDPTADRTITLPNISGTVVTSGDTGTVTNTMLAGSIANNKLTNSSVTINGYEIALGASATYGTDNINEGSSNKYFTDERAQDAVGNAVGTGLTYNDSTGAISVDTTTIQAKVSGVSDTEIGYLDGVTSSIQTQLDAKFATANASTSNISEGTNLYFTDERAQDAVGNNVGTGLSYNDSTGAISVDTSTIQARVTDVSDTEIGYLNGVTSAIQTQIDAKASLSGATFTGAVSGTSLTLSGDLTVNGTTTTINSTEITVDDKNLVLGSVATPSDAGADGGGITLKGSTDKTINWVDATDAWTSSEHFNVASGKSYYVNGTALKDVLETLTNKTISGSSNTLSNIANSSLTNSAITINGTSVSLGGTRTLGSDDISEGSTNKYFTDERAQDAIGNALGSGLSYNDSTGAISNSGVLSVTGTANQVVADASTGAVTLSLPQSIHTGATPTFSGVTVGSVTLTDALIGTATQALSDANATVVDSWSATTYSGAKYLVQMKNGNDIEILEILVAVDGNNNVYLTEYADVISNATIGTTDADYSGGNVRLKVTASNGTTVKVHKTLIEA
jgi:hypothetical protein